MTQLLQANQVPPAPAPPDPRRSLVQLIVVVAAAVVIAVVAHATYLLLVIVAIIAMVMLHELGHFATAKWSGMKVTEYFLGFGPKLWSVRRGETEYGVKALPVGGYVRIVGMSTLEEVHPSDEPRTYRQQPFHNRLAVAVAGSVMHFLIALVLIYALLVGWGLPDTHVVSVVGFSSWQGRTTPARQAGLEAGDVIVSVDGRAVRDYTDLKQVVSTHVGVPLSLVVSRHGRRYDLTVVPADGRRVKEDGQPALPADTKDPGLIGVALSNPDVRVSPLRAVGQSVAGSGVGLFPLIGSSVTEIPSAVSALFHDVTNAKAATQAERTGNRPVSIVGAVQVATQDAQAGAAYLISILITLNVFIGVVNLFPMLPLDGGHVVIAVYERLRSRRGRPYHADVRKVLPLAYLTVGLLGVIFLSSLYLDITHPIQVR